MTRKILRICSGLLGVANMVFLVPAVQKAPVTWAYSVAMIMIIAAVVLIAAPWADWVQHG